MYGNTNVNNGLAQNSVVMLKPKSKWQNSVLNAQQPQDYGLAGGIDSNLINSGYDASNVAITGSTTATPQVAPVAPTSGLASRGGTGWTDQQYVADQMLKTDPNANTPPKTEQGWFDVPEGAQTSKFASTLSGFGAGVQGLAALGSMYYAGKNYKLQKEAAELEKDKYARAVKADKADSANKQKFAANVGGGATYVGQ